MGSTHTFRVSGRSVPPRVQDPPRTGVDGTRGPCPPPVTVDSRGGARRETSWVGGPRKEPLRGSSLLSFPPS